MRAYVFRLRFLVCVLTLLGCSAEPPGGGSDRDGGSEPTGRQHDGGTRDGGPCVALGCDELGYECGKAVDNCGGPLACDPPGKSTACTAPERCGGDPDLGANRCGCKRRTNACEDEGATCGTLDECGESVTCGTCKNGALCIANKCACAADPNPCKDRVCGEVTDACGNRVVCGPSGGRCESGSSCSPAGQCVCPDRATACRGRSDAFTEGACSYDCSSSCASDPVRACAGAECGTARDGCGNEVKCGPQGGQCSAGQTCVGAQHVVDAALPARSAAYQGGYCLADNAALMVGKYAVRMHSFRQAGAALISFLNRAEAISYMTLRYVRATRQISLVDQPCVATSAGDPTSPIGANTRSWVPKYRNVKTTTATVQLNGMAWLRDALPHPVLGTGEPTGWAPGLPAYCVGREGQEVALPADDPRRGQSWLPNDRCLCPTALGAASLPRRPVAGDPNNYSTNILRDCRITDDDRDQKAGLTGRAKSLLFDSEIYTASTGHGIWRGEVRADRNHIAQVSDGVRTLETVTLGCRSLDPTCTPPSLDCTCPAELQTVQFVPLPDSATLDCNAFLQNGGADDIEDQAAIDRQFGVSFGSCTGAAPGQCPRGSICRNNRCFVQTAKGACAPDTCPGGNCEGCPAGTSCRADGACWPTNAVCPARGTGGLPCR